MARNFSVKTIFDAVDNVSGPVRGMTRNVERFARRSRAAVSRLDRSLGRVTSRTRQMGVVGGTALVGATLALSRLAKTGAEFEDTLVSAGAKFPGFVRRGTEAFREIQREAELIGRTTEFSANQAAQGLEFLARAGFNAEQAVASLRGVVDIATVGQLELGEASDIATDTLGAFNLMTKDTIQLEKNLARVNDVLAKTVTTSNTSIVQFFEAMKESGAAAQGAGADIETYAAAVGILAQSGTKASKAGTTLKRVFLQLAAPTGMAARTLRRLNVSVSEMVDGRRNLRDVIDIFADLERSLAGLGTADRSQALRNIFGLIPIAGINVLLTRGSDAWRSYREELRSSQGAMTSMANVMRDTVMKNFIALTSAVEGLQIALFNLEKDTIERNIKLMTEWVRALVKVINANEDLTRNTLRDLAKGVKGVVVAFVAFVAIVVTLRTVLLGLQIIIAAFQIAVVAVTAIMWLWRAAAVALAFIVNTNLVIAIRLAAISITSTLMPAFVALWALMVANPIGLVIVAIGLLVAAGVAIWKNWATIKEKLTNIWSSLKSTFNDFIDSIVSKFKLFGKIAEFISKPFKDAFSGFAGFSEGIDKLSQATDIQVGIDRASLARSSRGLSLGGFLSPEDIEAAQLSAPGERFAQTVDNRISSFMELTLRTDPGTSAEVTGQSGPLKPAVITTPSGL